MSKLRFHKDPKSDAVSQEQDAKFRAFAAELDVLCRKHNYPAYLVTVSTEETVTGKKALFSTAIATLDQEMAIHLVADAMRAMKNLMAYLNPTAPGGVS